MREREQRGVGEGLRSGGMEEGGCGAEEGGRGGRRGRQGEVARFGSSEEPCGFRRRLVQVSWCCSWISFGGPLKKVDRLTDAGAGRPSPGITTWSSSPPTRGT